jgi:hypothetical protein
VLATPLARGEETFQQADARLAAIAFVALVAALVRGWSSLVPVGIALAGGAYAVELAVDDAPLDIAAPGVAVGLVLAAELAYWSLDERNRARGDAGDGLRRATLAALGGVAAVVVAGALLVLVDAVRTRGLALDLLGAFAAVAVLATMLLSRGHDD